MYETVVEANVPFPYLMTHFVSVVEFVGGSLLTVGLLSSLALRGLIGRYACRHFDHQALRHA
jgi:putative oxidoreductase